MTTDRKLIPASEISRLAEGSYEQLILQLNKVVAEESERIFGEACDSKVVSTFKSHAVVVSESGDFRRIGYEIADDKSIKLTMVEDLQVSSYTDRTVDDLVAREAGVVVDNFLRGTVKEAWNRLRGLVPLISEGPTTNADKVLKVVEDALQTPCPWKQMYQEKKDSITKLVWSKLPDLEKDRLQPKFGTIYNGSLSEDVKAQESYRSLVESDVANLSKRLNSLLDRVSSATAKAGPVLVTLKEGSEGDIVTTFGAFSEDFLEDLDQIQELVSRSARDLIEVPNLAKLYDTVSESLYRYEVAGLFIEKIAKDLIESVK